MQAEQLISRTGRDDRHAGIACNSRMRKGDSKGRPESASSVQFGGVSTPRFNGERRQVIDTPLSK